MKIYCLLGLMESGKDTLLHKYKIKYSEITLHNVKFADGVKQLCNHYLGMIEEDYETTEGKNSCYSPNPSLTHRDILKIVGETLRLKINPYVWINFTRNKLKQIEQIYVPNYSIVFLTDLRFQKEYEFLVEELDVVIIDVYRQDKHTKAKKVIDYLGVNWLSRLFIHLFVDKRIAHTSEWTYFTLVNKAHYHLNNTDLDKGFELLEKIINEN